MEAKGFVTAPPHVVCYYGAEATEGGEMAHEGPCTAAEVDEGYINGLKDIICNSPSGSIVARQGMFNKSEPEPEPEPEP